MSEGPLRKDQLDPETTKDGHWRSSISTVTGIEFFPLSPTPADIRPEDVAHALGNKCRFTGHTKVFYSVAQHCHLVSDLLQKRYPDAPMLWRWGLLHDASEAYLPDVAAPIKPYLAGFAEIEDTVHRAVAERFHLPWPMPREVHVADAAVFRRERLDVMNPCSWWKSGGEVASDVPEISSGWDPNSARVLWWTRYSYLEALPPDFGA